MSDDATLEIPNQDPSTSSIPLEKGILEKPIIMIESQVFVYWLIF